MAYEHYSSAIQRFAWFWMKIEVLTRFETITKAQNIIKKLKSWEIDLIIWTHRLLSEKIEYKNLWLLIIDEEHKFWVEQKEQIKSFSWHIDILSMSATPIPRSLNMAFNWIKDFSILSHPPLNRKWIETFVSKFNDNIIKNAISQEFQRDWQVFFIHNRVETIETMQNYLHDLFPRKKIIITHGQLPWHELENRILDFKNKNFITFL